VKIEALLFTPEQRAQVMARQMRERALNLCAQLRLHMLHGMAVESLKEEIVELLAEAKELESTNG
jgi:hypothetical protein